MVPETEPNQRPGCPCLLGWRLSAVFRCPQKCPQNEKYPPPRCFLLPIHTRQNQPRHQPDYLKTVILRKQEKGSPRRSGKPYSRGFNLPPPVPCLGVLLPLASGSCVGRPRCQRQLLELPQVVTLAALLTRCGAVTVLAASCCLACVVLSAGAVRRPNRNRNRWRWQLPVHSETSGHELPAGGGGSGSTFWAGLGHAAQGVGL